MKTLNNMVEKYMRLSFIKRWLVSMLILFLPSYVIADEIMTRLSNTTIAQYAGVTAFFFGLHIAYASGQMRKSAEFWKAAKEFESKVEMLNDKSKLQFFYINEFPSLMEKSLGGPHAEELNRLHTMITTKVRYMCDNKQ